MNSPRIELVALVELEASDIGDLDYSAVREALRFIDAAHGRAVVVVRGVLRVINPQVVRMLGAALFDAQTIEVSAKGPAAVQFAQGVAEAASEERGYRPGAA